MVKKIEMAIGILLISLGIGFLIVMIIYFPTDEAENADKTFVSSFVVDGVDKGAGYFSFYDYPNSEYHFTGQSGEITVYREMDVDNYTLDESKLEESKQANSIFLLWLTGVIFVPAICFSAGGCFISIGRNSW